MLRKVSTPALVGLSSACARTLSPLCKARDSVASLAVIYTDATSSTLHARTLCSACHALCTPQRFYVHTSRVARDDAAQQAPPSSPGAAPAGTASAGTAPPSNGTSTHESALDVAMRVNKLKKTHQTGGAGMNKKEVEQEAWQALNLLTEDQINNAEGKAVSLLLNSWAYFAKYWAKGKDGPL